MPTKIDEDDEPMTQREQMAADFKAYIDSGAPLNWSWAWWYDSYAKNATTGLVELDPPSTWRSEIEPIVDSDDESEAT